jgi:hypothetical protein
LPSEGIFGFFKRVWGRDIGEQVAQLDIAFIADLVI